MSLPALSLRRTTFKPPSLTPLYLQCQQTRTATQLKRPKRPYTFTQIVTLSDGSAFTQRTTSPLPVYRSTRDTRNAPMWNPSSHKLSNQEQDEAGRLAAFRLRFGRRFDAVDAEAGDDKKEGEKKGEKGELDGKERQLEEEVNEEDENLLDLITGFGQDVKMPGNEKDVIRSRKRQT